MNGKFLSVILTIIVLTVSSIGISGAQNMQDDSQRLNVRQQNIAAIAALTAKGDLAKLKPALAKGLEQGLTINEIKEVLVQMYAYCGFPRSLSGINTFISVVDERKAQGIQDNWGKESTPITNESDKYARGKAVLETLTGRSDTGKNSGFGAFSPEIDDFLKEHLFADIFERDVLSYSDRELATIAALMALGGVEPMLQSHINMGMSVGLTEAQLKEVISIISTTIGPNDADRATEVLNAVLDSKK